MRKETGEGNARSRWRACAARMLSGNWMRLRTRPGRAAPSGSFARDREGQSTTEYLLVLFAFLAVFAALHALARLGENATLGSLATRSASHAVGSENTGSGIMDMLLY